MISKSLQGYVIITSCRMSLEYANICNCQWPRGWFLWYTTYAVQCMTFLEGIPVQSRLCNIVVVSSILSPTTGGILVQSTLNSLLLYRHMLCCSLISTFIQWCVNVHILCSKVLTYSNIHVDLVKHLSMSYHALDVDKNGDNLQLNIWPYTGHLLITFLIGLVRDLKLVG